MTVVDGAEITYVYCCSCGAEIFMRQDRLAVLKDTRELFHCLNGHPQSYRKSSSDIEREELRKKLRDREQRIEDLSASLERAKQPGWCSGCDVVFRSKIALANHRRGGHHK